MNKGIDLNFDRYVGNLKKKLASLEEDIGTILQQKDVQTEQINELEAKKDSLLVESTQLKEMTQKAKTRKLELLLRNQQLNKEFKQKNTEYIKLVDDANDRAQALQQTIDETELECAELKKEVQKALHANDDLVNKKEQLSVAFSVKQHELEQKMKEWGKVAAVDNKRREVLAKTLTELQF